MPYLDVLNDMGIDALAASSGVARFGRIIDTRLGSTKNHLGHTSRLIGVGTPLQVRIVCETTVTSGHASNTFKMKLVTDTVAAMNSAAGIEAVDTAIGTEPATGATTVNIAVGNADSNSNFKVQKGTLITFADVSGVYEVQADAEIARNTDDDITISPGIIEGEWTGKAVSINKAGFDEDLWTWEGELSAGDVVLVPMPLEPVKDYLGIYYNPVVLASETFSAGKIKAFIEPHLG